MKRFIKYALPLCTFFITAGIVSCSHSDTSSPPTETPVQLIGDGWQAYSNHQYQLALNKFNSAISLNGSMVDAYNGAGWSSAKLNQLSNAATIFGRGNVRDTTNTDILAGLALVNNGRKNYSVSAASANAVLQKNAHWFFERDTLVDYYDIRVVLAEDDYALGDFSSSLAVVRLMDASFSADVTGVQGQTALAQEIERLRNLYQ